jgi:hypothetical protein
MQQAFVPSENSEFRLKVDTMGEMVSAFLAFSCTIERLKQ